MKRLALFAFVVGSVGCSEKVKPNPAPSIFAVPAQVQFAPADPELFKRLGGKDGILKIAEAFVVSTKLNDKVSPDFKKLLDEPNASASIAGILFAYVDESFIRGAIDPRLLFEGESDFEPIVLEVRKATIDAGMAARDADEFTDHIRKTRATKKMK